jgi:hypothetical protein
MAYIRDENGNYKRTVRCSYCYDTGHSQRTCPDKYPNGTPAQQRARAREEEKANRKLAREQRKRDKAAGREGQQDRPASVDTARITGICADIARHSRQTRPDWSI